MIIQALHRRYTLLSEDASSGLSPLGFSAGKTSYVLELDHEGTLLNVADIRDRSGKKPIARSGLVPEQPSRANGINPYFLVDKAEYIIGYYNELAKPEEAGKKAGEARRKFVASGELARRVLEDVDDMGARAVLAFYAVWDAEKVREHPLLQPYQADLDKGIDTQMVFRLRGGQSFVHESEAVKAAWIRYRGAAAGDSEYRAQCLLTGETNVPIAKLHGKVKGVRNAQQAGASLVSFNFRAVESYGKDDLQSFNSPVGKTAEFAYTTALNHLLASSANRMLVGDMTVVFWAEHAVVAAELEPFFAAFMDRQQADAEEQSALTGQLHGILKRVKNGARLTPDMVPHGDIPFYVLGLSPNNARVAVRFFWQGSFGEMLDKLGRHAADFALVGSDDRRETETPTIYRILAETLRVGGDGKKVGDPPPRLGGELFRAIMQGTAYPYSLYVAIINRIRADGIVNSLRAMIIKGYLARYSRIHLNDKMKEELTVSVNTSSTETAYRLGQVFAVLERAQQDAAGGAGRLNATIKDRYFSTASSNPGAVFPVLIKLAQHHMSKSRYGDFRDREMQEILKEVDHFPAHLDLQRQGLFILGYYHQKQQMQAQIRAAAEAKEEAAAALGDSEREQQQ